MPLPGQNAPDLREEGSSNTGSDGFHSLVQQAVADSMASVTIQISSLIDTRFDNFKNGCLSGSRIVRQRPFR